MSAFLVPILSLPAQPAIVIPLISITSKSIVCYMKQQQLRPFSNNSSDFSFEDSFNPKVFQEREQSKENFYIKKHERDLLKKLKSELKDTTQDDVSSPSDVESKSKIGSNGELL
ncbi:uncharacterized protein ASCRUDRAFT_157595 [Ascoidea rubescens DSM 1968]|uniref:Uncharacterized protein n=1 Tax=Ascoidea rubescens DSM 1968 TaxID=1344418 RepID=A0A1D2VF28_9ASCO|nr:hypothetical protein ASCRUDRAFT_157595 [Ascoidea rubescens DSM 1968]ODV60225.1 hypothetical protein ASCRUDRAFT_157595 [Ascoidea rubescens DSM 1968]